MPAAAGVLVLLAAAAAVSLSRYAQGPAGGGREAVTVYIPAGSSFAAIEKALVRGGALRPDRRFAWLAAWRGVSRSLRAGEYRFPAGVTADELLTMLVRGETLRREVTIAEGLSLRRIEPLLAALPLSGATEIPRLTHDSRFLAALGVRAASLEGYLFPDTYYYRRGMSARALLTIMVGRMKKVVVEECRAAGGSGCAFDGTFSIGGRPPVTAHALLTLASIVEKETARDNERPLVAEVFWNRLRRGMRLQADPTVLYGLGKSGAAPTRQELKSRTPYNTYTRKGLPPGPICNPGRASIAAALAPAAKGNLYFVADGRGGHVFSKTLAAHNRAVARWRAARKKASKN